MALMRGLGLHILAVLLALLLGASSGLAAGFVASPNTGDSPTQDSLSLARQGPIPAAMSQPGEGPPKRVETSRLTSIAGRTFVQWSREVLAVLAAGVCGDQNGDGRVDVVDIIIDLQIAVGLVEPTEIQEVLSDLNSDGSVNVFDAVIGLQHIVGMIPSLDECGLPESE